MILPPLSLAVSLAAVLAGCLSAQQVAHVSAAGGASSNNNNNNNNNSPGLGFAASNEGAVEYGPGIDRDNVGLVMAQTEDYKVLGVYHHDKAAFTQGLSWHDGKLYESVGEHGKSGVRIVEARTGEILKISGIEGAHFGEGMVIHKGKIHMLTWQSGVGHTFDPVDLIQGEKFNFKTTTGEGWGVTSDGERLIVSDGSEWLHMMDPDTHELLSRVQVHTNEGKLLYRINELEFINGYVFANVWFSDKIYKINPSDGLIVKEYDFKGLYSEQLRRIELWTRDAVLNGIAYDSGEDVLYLTGKLWPRLYKVKLLA